MKSRKKNLDKTYRKKLLQLVRLHKVKEIKKKLFKFRLTEIQIESLLKKNNITVSKNISKTKLNSLNWINLYKTFGVAVLVIGFFSVIPLIYDFELNNTPKDLVKNKELILKNKIENQNLKKLTKKNEIDEDFIFQQNIEDKEVNNTVRLEAATLNEIFKSANYDLDVVRKTKKVKPIYISVLPTELNSIENTKEKKDLFIKIVLPLILGENEKIISDRNKLFRLLGKIKNSRNEKIWLSKKFKEYEIKDRDLSELKIRMDIIPVSLAIAQAAKETGWGTSRFALEGNALFGQWTYSENGMEPYGNVTGDHKVMKFNILQASVKAYKRNLNTHRVYKKFRLARAELRERGQQINSLILVKFLDKYAETGDQYVDVLQKIIKQNSLMDFDQAKLLPTKSVINQNI